MDKKKIYFLSLNILPFVPYVFSVLKSYCDQDPELKKAYQWQQPFYLPEPFEITISKFADPNLLLVSSYVWNFETHLHLCRALKKIYPKMKIVMGGPHVPDSAEEFLRRNPFIDIAVHGEGEIALAEILRENLSSLNNWRSIKGISFLSDGEFVYTGKGKRVENYSTLPSPYLTGNLDLVIEDAKSKGISLLYLWETSRGCPYSCTFCDWGGSTMSKTRQVNLPRLEKEIIFFQKHFANVLFLCDANFGLFESDLSVTDLICSSKARYGYPKQVRVTFAKKSNERVFAVSKKLSRAGLLNGTTISLQSVNPESLTAIRRINIEPKRLAEIKQWYTRESIPTYTEIILGLPYETLQTFKMGLCSLMEAGIHEDIRVFELAILPNAPINNPKSLSEFEFMLSRKPLLPEVPGQFLNEYLDIVVATKWMSFQDWIECLIFSSIIQTFHNGAFTRFVAIFLHRECNVSFFDFYNRFHAFLAASIDPSIKKIFGLITSTEDAFARRNDIPQLHRATYQPELVKVLQKFDPDRTGWHLYQALWLLVSAEFEGFSIALAEFLNVTFPDVEDKLLVDLLRFQKEVMLTPEFNPETGKTCQFEYNWVDYFAHGAPLKAISNLTIFLDKKMGAPEQYLLKFRDLKMFSTAAVGEVYPFQKQRHFFHQLDSCELIYPSEQVENSRKMRVGNTQDNPGATSNV